MLLKSLEIIENTRGVTSAVLHLFCNARRRGDERARPLCVGGLGHASFSREDVSLVRYTLFRNVGTALDRRRRGKTGTPVLVCVRVCHRRNARHGSTHAHVSQIPLSCFWFFFHLNPKPASRLCCYSGIWENIQI